MKTEAANFVLSDCYDMLHAFDMGSSTEVSRPSPPTSIFVPGNTAPNVITYHHHPQHAPPSMPHYNSKGEFIKVTYNQVIIFSTSPKYLDDTIVLSGSHHT